MVRNLLNLLVEPCSTFLFSIITGINYVDLSKPLTLILYFIGVISRFPHTKDTAFMHRIKLTEYPELSIELYICKR